MRTRGYSGALAVGIALTALAALFVAAGSASSKPAGWRVVDLGTLGGKVAFASTAVAINAHGDVIGNSWNRSGTRMRAFVWRSGRLIPLGTLGGGSSWARALNDRGQIVGWAETRSGKTHAFLWEKGHMRDLGVPPGTDMSEAVCITNSGLVVGVASSVNVLGPALGGHLVVWRRDGRIRDLGMPWNPIRGQGAASTFVGGVNEHGEIVGSTVPDHVGERSFLWDGRKLRTLPPRNARSMALDVNASGRVIGWTYRGSNFRAVTWERGQMRLLPLPPGRKGAQLTESVGLVPETSAINNEGDIVGEGWADREVDNHALLWRIGTVIDLGTLGGKQSQAGAINNRRQIVGISETAHSDSQSPVWDAFLWQDGRMVDLGSGKPVAINDRGQIIGSSVPYGSLSDGDGARVWIPN